MMKQAGYNVGQTAFSTPEMENDAKNAHQYFRQIHAKNVKPGDIVIVNVGTGYGPNGHTAIIDGSYHGKKTQIIEIGGIDPMGAVHRSTIAQSFQSLLKEGRITYAHPTKYCNLKLTKFIAKLVECNHSSQYYFDKIKNNRGNENELKSKNYAVTK